MFPLTPAQLQQAIDQRRDPTVVGFANFYRWEGGICCFGNVAVAPRARGRGVGQYLIRTMIGLARENHGATEGRVSCFNANVGGLLLYTKLGFEPFSVEERRAPDGRRVALIHMRGPAAETDKAVGSSAPGRLGD